MTEVIVSIVLAIFASGGFWTFLQTVYQNRSKKSKAENMVQLGLARSEIIKIGNEMLKEKTVKQNDFKDYDEFCKAYLVLGGNGGGEAKYEEVKKNVSII